MKKKETNRKMIIIALLLVSVLATGAFIGTLAKYATSGDSSDSATAAKFGLNVPNSIDLFSDSYTNVTADEEGKKIIAPGTGGQYQFEVTGNSEVAYKVSADISITYSEEWKEYAPLEFSLDGTVWTSLSDFKENLSTALARETMAPGEEYTNKQTIYWQWPFYTSDEEDAKDTALGVAAAAQTAPKVTVNIKVTATQLD